MGGYLFFEKKKKIIQYIFYSTGCSLLTYERKNIINYVFIHKAFAKNGKNNLSTWVIFCLYIQNNYKLSKFTV